MQSGPYRRLPVVDHERRLVGIVSLDDVVKVLAAEFGEIGKLLCKESPKSWQRSHKWVGEDPTNSRWRDSRAGLQERRRERRRTCNDY